LLKWRDDENDVIEEEFEENKDEVEEQEQNEATEVINPSSSSSSPTCSAENNEYNQPATRNRRTPYWMQDYVTCAGLYEEEET
jgi:hypothetical protein